MKLDTSKLVFDGCWESAYFDEVTVYFIAPKELVGDRFGNASEIMISYSKSDPYNCRPEIMVSPTEGGESYDWDYLDLENEEDAAKELVNMCLERMRDRDG